MKKYNLEATDENILNTISNDMLQRTGDVKDFVNLLDSIDYNAFVALDAAWGEGKTFFVRQVELTLKYYNKKEFGKTITETEQTAFGKNINLGQLQLKHTYLPVYFNSWLYDNHSNALMSLLLVMVKQCESEIDTKISSENGEKLSVIMDSIQFWKSSNWQNLKTTFQGRDILEEARLLEDIRDMVKSIFNEILVERAEKLVVFIDELDRCRPTFAVEILECIKHYFDDDRIIFVMSINKAQLIHTISKYYGINFDSDSYLNKFFDVNIRLPKAATATYFDLLGIACDDGSWLKMFANDLQKIHNLSLRDTTVYYQRINQIDSKGINSLGRDTRSVLYLLLPILCVLQIKDIEKLEKLFQGKGFEIIKDIVLNSYNMQIYLKTILGNDPYDIMDIMPYIEELKMAYEFAFNNNGRDSWNAGKLKVDSEIKQACIRYINIH